jgi:tRNA threonylcarbamoyladenosine biosynthesis protein TsaE
MLKDIKDTDILGNCLSKVLEPGSLLFLSGDLGAGKTTLTKAIASGLGIDAREVTSPSFTIIHEHLNGRLPFIHVDLYRLGPHADISEIGLEDYLDGEKIVIVEWSEYLNNYLVEKALQINLNFAGEKSREAHLSGRTEVWYERLLLIDKCIKASEK